MLNMIASLLFAQRREAEKNLPVTARAMEQPIEMQALMEMEAEQKMHEIEEQSLIRRITVTPVTATQMQEICQQQKNESGFRNAKRRRQTTVV